MPELGAWTELNWGARTELDWGKGIIPVLEKTQIVGLLKFPSGPDFREASKQQSTCTARRRIARLRSSMAGRIIIRRLQ